MDKETVMRSLCNMRKDAETPFDYINKKIKESNCVASSPPLPSPSKLPNLKDLAGERSSLEAISVVAILNENQTPLIVKRITAQKKRKVNLEIS